MVTLLSKLFSSSRCKLPKDKGRRPTKGDERMGMKFKDIELLLISNVSAAFFAVAGAGLGSVAYFKYKAPVQETVKIEIKDTRNPLDVERENKITKAAAMMDKKLYKSAEELLSEVYQETPKNTYVLSMLSFCEKKIGRLESAERHLAEAIELDQGQWTFHNNMGMLLFERGRSKEALERFEKALELSPKNFRVLLSKGRVLEQMGKFTDARLAYGRSMESGEIDAATLGIVKDRLKKLDVLAYIERGDK